MTKEVGSERKFISALLLAAGKSKRMGGKAKQLLPLGKSTIIDVTISTLLSSAVDETIVVLGHHAKEIIRHLEKTSYIIKVVVNEAYEEGMSSSLKSGIKKIDDKSDAVLVTVVDKPLISVDVIDDLLEEYRAGSKGIVFPTYQGERGHPVIFDMKYRDELLRISGDIGGKSIVGQHQEDTLDVEVLTSDILIDVDTEEDYKNITKFFDW